MVTIEQLINKAKCYEVVRKLRWLKGVHCTTCDSKNVRKRGLHGRYSDRQRYECYACQRQFNDSNA